MVGPAEAAADLVGGRTVRRGRAAHDSMRRVSAYTEYGVLGVTKMDLG